MAKIFMRKHSCLAHTRVYTVYPMIKILYSPTCTKPFSLQCDGCEKWISSCCGLTLHRINSSFAIGKHSVIIGYKCALNEEIFWKANVLSSHIQLHLCVHVHFLTLHTFIHSVLKWHPMNETETPNECTSMLIMHIMYAKWDL